MTNCFTFRKGKISEGIQVTFEKRLGNIIALGIKEEGWKHSSFLGLLKRNEPEIVDGKVLYAFPHDLEVTDKKKNQTFIRKLLRAPWWNTKDLVILRVNTLTDERKVPSIELTEALENSKNGKGHKITIKKTKKQPGWSCGRIEKLRGNPDLIKGTTKLGWFVNKYNFSDDIFIMRNGDAIRIIPEGSGKLDYMVVYNKNGKLNLINDCDFSRDLFIEKPAPKVVNAIAISEPVEVEEECSDEEWEAALREDERRKAAQKVEAEEKESSASEISEASATRDGGVTEKQKSPVQIG